ncbi:MAG: tRNA (adenosine(37)-N6)-threonylcarbamoyltransferase complex ATPase subunit type 1 TsaE [Pedosphaera sp.]|nr:tRNA (adenosine(37)-N6)-threonylcarbamoyltransferase complex ATPase subunit type 1 TsaE [Pedosphaera sp.]
MPVFSSHSPSETEDFGQRVAQIAQAGWILGLEGDLGAGKTAFVRGLVHGLGSSAQVHSPTFALINQYSDGRLPVTHIDLYRLHSSADLQEAGLEDSLQCPEILTVVEWVSRTNLGSRPNVYYLNFHWTGETSRDIAYDLPGL